MRRAQAVIKRVSIVHMSVVFPTLHIFADSNDVNTNSEASILLC